MQAMLSADENCGPKPYSNQTHCPRIPLSSSQDWLFICSSITTLLPPHHYFTISNFLPFLPPFSGSWQQEYVHRHLDTRPDSTMSLDRKCQKAAEIAQDREQAECRPGSCCSSSLPEAPIAEWDGLRSSSRRVSDKVSEGDANMS